MKKKLRIFSLALLVIGLFGCSMGNTPTAKVEGLLNKYQNKAAVIVNELDDYLKTLTIDEGNYDSYKNVYLKQYADLTYEIKDEKIDGDNATVTAQIDVYDYYKVEKDVNSYIAANPTEFAENGTYSAIKGLKYKIDKLNSAKDRVTYTVTFKLTKVEDKWTVDTLSNEDLEKIHGTYAH